jgi:LuxR family transcriptional regulator, maltose regulon positive regulatory protein
MAARAPAAPHLIARPRLFELLDQSAPVTLVCAPAGSGKTMLLSSWLDGGAPGPVAWVQVERDEEDATRFWGAVAGALRDSGAVPACDPLATLTPAPLDGHDEFVQRLLEDLQALPQPVLLVLDDLHHLRSEAALGTLEHLLAEAPDHLRTVVISRRDPKLGLHRLRLAGRLTEIRGADLDFTADEAAELMATAGVSVGTADLGALHGRCEGWAAGLRLAALSLARHDAPARFVAEFSGSERTVADYLLGEVLASRPPEVRDLLLRTCVLERVSGPLADVLTGRDDGARLLGELEEENALVVAVDVGRRWFRYHHLLADLLRLELQREAPSEVPALHRTAAGWLAEHGDPIAAIRHARQGGDTELATELLGRHWVHLVLDGEETTLATLMAGLPTGDAELATISAAACLARSRWAEADALLDAAERALPTVSEARRNRAETSLASVQLFRARRLGDIESVVDGALELLHADGDAEQTALALLNLGIAETWTLRLPEAQAHLEQGLALARQSGRPFLEVGCTGALGVVANLSSRLDEAETLLRDAIAQADQVGWSSHPVVGASYLTLGAVLVDRGQLDEAEQWLARAEPLLADAPEPAASVGLCHAQGMLAFARGRTEAALASFEEGERLTGQLRAPHFLGVIERQWQLRSRLALGEYAYVRGALGQSDGGAFWLSLEARLHLAADDPAAAARAVAPVVAGEAFVYHPTFEIEALVLDALARTRLGDAAAAEASLERALAIAEPIGRVYAFLTIPGIGDALAAHPVHRSAHPGHLRTLQAHVAGAAPAGELAEPLSERELAVLRFLPTNLSASEIGGELFLSVHTVKTHMRKLYAKLGAHTRSEAVERGRAHGLLGHGVRLPGDR